MRPAATTPAASEDGRSTAPQVLLGLWDGHDAGVALSAGGQIVFALSEERPARRKRCSGFPTRALELAVAFAERDGLAIDEVVVAGRTGRAPMRLLDRLYAASNPNRDPLSVTSALVRGWDNVMPHLPVARAVERAAGLLALRARLRGALGRLPSISFVEHHEAHAFSALLGASGEPALAVTWDAYGEGVAFTARCAESPRTPIVRLGPAVGLARLYGVVTVALGFGEGDEGKVMGLAARGDAERGIARFRALFEVDERGAPRLRRPLRQTLIHELIDGISRDDACAALQRLTEEVATAWIRAVLRASGAPRRLLLAGGLFANVRLNQALSSLPEVSGVFVFPNMGDGGLPVGAIAGAAVRPLSPLRHVYLGCTFDGEGHARAASTWRGPVRRVPDRAEAIAAHLAAGRVVCVHQGRDEFGPRALGHRSILFSAVDAAAATRVNGALRRDDFMPFAPLVRCEDAADALRTRLPASDLGYMTIATGVADDVRGSCPAAVHLDGTVRPQVVEAQRNPVLHAVLGRLRAAGKPPIVVNTSFNLHGEPIVHTPEDALRTFAASGLDVLMLGDFEIRRAGGDDRA